MHKKVLNENNKLLFERFGAQILTNLATIIVIWLRPQKAPTKRKLPRGRRRRRARNMQDKHRQIFLQMYRIVSYRT